MQQKIIYTKILLRVAPESLNRIDKILRSHYGMTKSEWIRNAIDEKLERRKVSK